jgi:hypothetical protein
MSTSTTGTTARALGSPGLRRRQGKPDEVRASGMLGPAATLLRVQGAIRVDLGLEAGQERGSGGHGRLPSVVARVHGVGCQSGAEASLRRGQAMRTARGRHSRRGTLLAHLRGSFPGVPLGCLAPAQLAAASGPPGRLPRPVVVALCYTGTIRATRFDRQYTSTAQLMALYVIDYLRRVAIWRQ